MALTAIFGGTFNPFHIGHFEMLKALNSYQPIDEIYVMPDKIPPHKVCDFLADDSDRIEMCRIAVSDFNKAKLCLLEFERDGKSYTFDTVCALEEKYPDKSFAFVCGGDMITSLHTWYRADELIQKIGFIAFRRQGESDDFQKAVDTLREKGADITVLPDSITEISSSELRVNINSDTAKKLIPEKIYNYIKEKGIYNAR